MFDLLHATQYPRMPWKNGAGTTLEIARDQGINLDTFGWRVSLADVECSGGFSRFPEHARIISVLEGAGMRLLVDGQPSRSLLPWVAFSFSGASEVHCELLGGAIRDFNLIYDPRRYQARLQWLEVQGPQQWLSTAGTVLVFSAGTGLHVALNSTNHADLQQHDCLHAGGLVGVSNWQLAATEAVMCCVIELSEINKPA